MKVRVASVILAVRVREFRSTPVSAQVIGQVIGSCSCSGSAALRMATGPVAFSAYEMVLGPVSVSGSSTGVTVMVTSMESEAPEGSVAVTVTA